MKLKLIIDPTKDELIEATMKRKNTFSDRLEELVLNYNGEDSIIAYREDEIYQLPFHKIECITIVNTVTYAIDCKGDMYKLKNRLYEIEEVLPSGFFRINKSSLASKQYTKKFAITFSGAVDVIFKSGYKDYVSRRCFAKIKKEWNL